MTLTQRLRDGKGADMKRKNYTEIVSEPADENARLREALSEVLAWIDNWSPEFVQDDEWPATSVKARALLAAKEPRP